MDEAEATDKSQKGTESPREGEENSVLFRGFIQEERERTRSGKEARAMFVEQSDSNPEPLGPPGPTLRKKPVGNVCLYQDENP